MACELTIKIAPDGKPIALTFWQGDADASAPVDLTGLTLEVRGQALPFTALPTITNATLGQASWLITPANALLLASRYRIEIWAGSLSVEAFQLMVVWIEPNA
jgi:hypothetical protein